MSRDQQVLSVIGRILSLPTAQHKKQKMIERDHYFISIIGGIFIHAGSMKVGCNCTRVYFRLRNWEGPGNHGRTQSADKSILKTQA